MYASDRRSPLSLFSLKTKYTYLGVSISWFADPHGSTCIGYSAAKGSVDLQSNALDPSNHTIHIDTV